MKRGDRQVLVAISLLALLSFVPRFLNEEKAPRWAVIFLDGREWRRMDAGESSQRVEVVTAEGRISVVEVDQGRIRFASSDCPDQICVHQGWINHSGISALCLPNRIEILLEGSEKGGDTVDAFSY